MPGQLRRATMLIAIIAAAATASAQTLDGFKATLQGVSAGATNTWITQNLMGWKELDFIPCRVYMTGGPANNKTITINFDHMMGHGTNIIPGIENLTSFSYSSNVIVESPPTLFIGTGTKWTYTLVIDTTDNQPATISFMSRLSAGAHLNTGSSLALSGQPSLGTLQIHKPNAAPGNPDLFVEKAGATVAAPGDVFTYTINFGNTSNATDRATGAQVTDILPSQVTYVPNSATGGGVFVGNTLTWTFFNVQPGTGSVLSYQVRVNDGVPFGQTFANFARAFSAETESNYSNNTSIVTTTAIFNRPPNASNDTFTVAEDRALTVTAPGVLANDSDPDGDALTAVLAAGPSRGTLTLNSNGSFTYLPATNFNGTDSFTYRAHDGRTDSAPATVTITVTPANDPPVAMNDAYSVNEDSLLVVSTPGVLANDSDLDGDALTAALVSGPTHGTLSLNTNGSFTYRPLTNYNGPDSFMYRANDGTTNSGPAIVSITVVPVNDPPVAVADAYTTAEDALLTVAAPGVLANDTDVDGNPLAAALVSNPAHGTVTLNGNGSFTYQPATNFNGTDSFTYRANDGIADSAPATVAITVTPVNDPPVAANDGYSLNEDTLLTVTAPGVLVNDSDVDGDPLTTVLVTGPAHGTLTLNTNGSFTYRPATNYNGPDSFTYKANDGTTNSAPATVSLTVLPVNDAPDAANDAFSVNEDSLLTVTAPGVLANDSDVDGDPLTAVLVNGPAHGTLTLNTNGSFIYRPATNYNGPDSFTYKANDGLADSAPVTVSITVNPVNDPPVAANDAYSVNEDTLLTVAAAGVLANDSDVDGDPLTAILVAAPAHGTLTLNTNGSFIYRPATNFNGTDTFTYKANDGAADSAPATVTITVFPVNDPPVAANDSYSTPEDTLLTVAAPGVLANDSDLDGDPLTAILVGGPAHGTLTLATNGSFTYRPATNFNGTDSFTYKANDGALDSGVATVTIMVTPVNDAPVAANDSYTTAEDTLLAIATPGVLANDSDVDGDPLTAVLVSTTTNGTLTLNTNGSFTYRPNTNFNGLDRFTYTANDGLASSALATVMITVTPVNDPPVAANDAYSVNEDTLLTVAAPGVLANDSDVDGDPLKALLVAAPAHGTLTLNTNGSLTYRPNTNFNGIDSFTYKANDGMADSSVATVTITVNPVNDPPVAANDAYPVNEDTLLTVAAPGVLANDTDADLNLLTAVLVSTTTNGTLTLNTNGSFTYRPNTNFNGTDSFTYKANDGLADSGVATVTVTVNPVNDPPVAANDAYTTAEDTLLVVASPGVLANDTDVDGDPLKALLVAGPANGTLTLGTNGSLSYRPNTNFNGTDSFTYKANDGVADSGIATVTITVTPVNDPPVAANDSYATPEDVLLVIAAPGVLANDSDIDLNPLTALLVSTTTNGTLTLGTNGSFSYRPNTNFNGTDHFTYKANDGVADSAAATVTITVTPVNDPPVAANDAYSVNEDTLLNVAAPGVLANDSDVDGDPLTAALVTGPAHGTLTLNTNGSFTYLPATNFNGMDSFSYKANDGALDSAPATVTINVVPGNDPPVAANDAYTTAEDTLLTVNAPGVLANDSDIDGDALIAVLVSGPTNGTLTLNTNGSFSYRPGTNFNGADSFSYKANDGLADSAAATVAITVTPANDAPVAAADSYTTAEDTLLTIAVPGVLANDSDVDGDVLKALLVSGPSHGTLTLNTNGSFSYRPATNFNGTDSFTYKANDGALDSAPATVTITVTPGNDAPVAASDSYTTPEDTLLTVAAPGVLANDSDVDNDPLTAVLVTGPARGALTLNTNGSFTYLPAMNFHGADSFTYTANDGALDSAPATVTITVTPVNDAPVAGNNSYDALEDNLLSIAAPGVLSNDTDVDNDALTAALVSGPMHGTLTLNTNGSFTYLASTNYNGLDSFTYRASDGITNSATATVTINVVPVNDPPSFVKGPDQFVQINSPAQTISNWATAISAGPPDEAGQS
ncbi:MAG TPA: Ig-like domain-containing protein, partial [Verrucomicrobiae bacterium]